MDQEGLAVSARGTVAAGHTVTVGDAAAPGRAVLARSLGRRGEDYAARWLRERGFAVVAANWRSRRGELDLVALDPGTAELVGVEVKTRGGTGFGFPAEAVTAQKLARLHRLVADFARSEAGEAWARCPRRVDVLALVWPPGAALPASVEHYRAVIP